VLLVGDRRAVQGVVDVALGNRFALQHRLLFADRDRFRDLLGDDVLAQAGAALLPLAGADAEQGVTDGISGAKE
jgi:hypothetical protein